MVKVTLSCSHVLDSSDLDSINSYGMVNGNCGYCETDHVCVDCPKFDTENKSLSYFNCKRECHDKDENIENLTVDEIEK